MVIDQKNIIIIDKSAEFWIKHLNLIKHPIGGYYEEFYRSDEIISKEFLPKRYSGNRVFSTSIYYLLEYGDFLGFNLIISDEIWHFYYGHSISLYIIDADGNLFQKTLGNNPDAQEEFQILLKAGVWFAAKVKNPNTYSLVGCTVAPGFDFKDFELGDRENLISKYPNHKNTIIQFTR